MIFNSLTFIVFFILFLSLYFLVTGNVRRILILLASYLFYGWWDYRYLSLIILSTCIDYFVGKKLHFEEDKKHRNILLAMSVFANLGILFSFKYFNFFTENFSAMALSLGLTVNQFTLDVLLPVGISFYTFQTMSYTIDVYRGKIDCERNFVTFSVFVAFFPQLVAGPIERASSLLPQLRAPGPPSQKQIADGISLVLWGYFLKVFIADNISRVAEYYFSVPTLNLTSPEVVAGCLAFTIQIYGDFAGYSNIARGISKMLGVELMVNFRQPYLAANPAEFWQRWHISLSTWFRDYLYIPLGGNRNGIYRTVRNLVITMFLAGLWHGASWLFVIWGFYHGILLGTYNWLRTYIKKVGGTSVWWSFLSRLTTFSLCVYGWLIFRSESVSQLRNMTYAFFVNMKLPSGREMEIFRIYSFWLCLFFLIVLVADIFQERMQTPVLFKFNKIRHYLLPVTMLFLIIMFGGASDSFIYFQF